MTRLQRRSLGRCAGGALLGLLVPAAVAAGQGPAPTPSDCEGERTEAERATCAQQELAAAQAAHRRAFAACKAALSEFLGQQLERQEEAWRQELRLECAATDTRCLSVAYRERDDALRADYPRCGGPEQPPPTESEAEGRARTGMLPARWTPPHGRPQEVPFSFETRSASTGTMSTTLGVGGEHFRGSYVRIQESTRGELVTAVYEGWSSPEWESWKHDPDGEWTQTGVSIGEFARFYSGKVVATLSGSEGHSMRCQLTLKEPQSGLLGGGSGSCQISDGGTIALEF